MRIDRQTKIKHLIGKDRSVLVLGARGTGKSYYINNILSPKSINIKIDLLDSGEYFDFLKSPGNLAGMVEYEIESSGKAVIFIDEVQKVPQLLNEAHRLIEKYKDRVVFILTGSSARKLKRADVNLLAGRAIYIPFYPFSFPEINYKDHLEKILQFGALPESFLAEDRELREEYLRTYAHVYLKEEIHQESLTRNIDKFARFLEFAAFENGMPINYSKIAKQLSLSIPTVQAHYQILEDTLIVSQIPAWTFSMRKQLLKMPKYYLFDNGLLNALTGELKSELKESSYRYGRLFENMVVNEIIRYNDLNGFACHLYHYRTNHGAEIDLIIQRNARSSPVAIEIKSSTSPDLSDVKQLLSFKEEFPQAKCFVICRTKHPYTEKGIDFLTFPKGIELIFGHI